MATWLGKETKSTRNLKPEKAMSSESMSNNMSNVRIEPFERTALFLSVLNQVDEPLRIMKAIGPEKALLQSDSLDQRLLNGAISDYVQQLAAYARKLNPQNSTDLGLAISLYREAYRALRLRNTQRTRYFPEEYANAQHAFNDLIDALDAFAPLFPPETQPIFWRARAFRQYQAFYKLVDTPYGAVSVSVEREPKSAAWYRVVRYFAHSTDNRDEFKSSDYIAAGTVSGKGQFNAVPLYDDVDGGFWGVEAEWVTRTGKRFAWEIKLSDLGPSFSLVRENPIVPPLHFTRQGDVYFGPAIFQPKDKETQLNHMPDLVKSCEFNPAPVAIYASPDASFILEFKDQPCWVDIRHKNHRTIRVRATNIGIEAKSVGGKIHYKPPETDKD